MSPVVNNKDTRLVARVSQEVQELIRNAADLSGATISQFLVEAGVARATEVINQAQTIRLTMASANRIFEALENPPKPNAKLLAAARRYRNSGLYANNGNSEEA